MNLPEDEQIACGYKAFTLPLDHPFTPICKMHDDAYSQWLHGFTNRDLADVDKALLHGMLGIANEEESLRLRLQAYVYYGLVTAFRLMFRS